MTATSYLVGNHLVTKVALGARSLLVAYHQDGALRFGCKVGTSSNERELRVIAEPTIAASRKALPMHSAKYPDLVLVPAVVNSMTHGSLLPLSHFVASGRPVRLLMQTAASTDTGRMRMKVVAWNMHQRSLYGNWPVLRDDPKLGGAHVALLCEATGVPELPSRFGFHAEGNGSTKGSDCECSDLPYGCHKRRYSTAIATTDERANGLREIPDGPRPSRPGTWTARTVAVGNATVTAIALYGLHDGSYVASVRRSLKELSPIIEDDEYGRYLLLGGDLNILAGKPGPHAGLAVLNEFREFGLVDCLEAKLPVGRYNDPAHRADMDNCPCGLRDGCRHTRTFYSRARPEIPYQDDYLFASPRLADNGHLVGCFAPVVDATSPSDHAPVVAEFEI